MTTATVRRSLMLVVAAFSFCCSTVDANARVVPSGIADVEAAIELANHEYVDALERADARRFAELFAPDAVSMPPHGAMIRGRDAIETSIAAALKQMTFTRGELRTLETHLEGNLAYEMGSYRFDVVVSGASRRIEGRYLSVWRKVDDRWKIAIDASQPDAPAP